MAQSTPTSNWLSTLRQAQAADPKDWMPIQAVQSPKDKPKYTQPLDYKSSVGMMSNSQKLTPFENWLYGKLPGITAWMDDTQMPLMGMSVSKAMEQFNTSWAGKLLGVLDIMAEGAERVSGLVSQANLASQNGTWDEFTRDINSAWKAGSLFSDVTNLPILKRDSSGRVIGFSIPTDLPGSAGLAAARQKIAAGVPLEQVREELYNDLGALTLRSQLYDTYFHIVLDPLNYILPMIKPVETATAARKAIQTFGYADDYIEAVQKGLKLAEETRDVAKIAEYTAELAKITKSTIPVKGALPKLLTRAQRFTMALTGGDPWIPDEEIRGLSRIGRAKLNPFKLTPEARAHELVDIVSNNVGTYIISRFRDNPEAMVGAIKKAAESLIQSPQLGHAFVTRQGRTVQNLLRGFASKADDLMAQWNLNSTNRTLLNSVSTALGEDTAKVMSILANGDDAVGGLVGRLAKLNVNVSHDTLKTMHAALKETPYTAELFTHYMHNAILDHAGQQAVLQFGVKARGMVEKVFGVIKEAETLAFLRTNPAYVVSNTLNNELTMIARGLISTIKESDLEKWLDDFVGLEPHRMAQAFSSTGEEIQGAAKGLKIGTTKIAEASRGEADKFTKAADWIHDLNLGKADMGKLAQKSEKSASKRAFVSGYIQAMKRYYWKPGVGFDNISDFVKPSILNSIPDNIVSEIQNGIESSMGSNKKIEELFTSENINLNIKSVLDNASARAGFDVEKAMPPEFILKIQDGLTEAAKKGTVPEFIMGVRDELQKKFDDLSQTLMDDYAKFVENKIIGEGPGAIQRVFGDTIDQWNDAHLNHYMAMEEMGDELAKLTNYKQIDLHWQQYFRESDAYWTSAYNRMEAALRGIQKGAKSKGIAIPDGVVEQFRALKNQTKAFYKQRNSLWDSHYRALQSGKIPEKTRQEIQAILDTAYEKLIQTTESSYKKMTKLIGGQLRNTEAKNVFQSWRDMSLELTMGDMRRVQEFRASLSGKSPGVRNEMWTAFWQERQGIRQQMWALDRQASQAMSGDAKAAQMFDRASQRKKILELAAHYKITTATKSGDPYNQILLKTINKYLPEEIKATLPNGKYNSIYDIDDLNIVEQALRAQLEQKGEELPELFLKQQVIGEGEEVAEVAGKADDLFVPDMDKITGGFNDYMLPEQQFWMSRGMSALRSIEQGAIEQAAKKPFKFSDLPQETIDELLRYKDQVIGQAADARYASTMFAEFRRDAALLNYNRRFQYNTYLGMLAPYEFWMTQSLAKWALHSIDRPAMLSTYLRIKKMLETSGAPQDRLPSRLRGKIRVELPFLPDWMGTTFIDPMRKLLPFDTFAMGYEQYMQNMQSKEYAATRLLEQWKTDAKYNADDIQEALDTQQGYLWEQALSEAEQADANLRFDAFDGLSLLVSPHAPIVWAMQAIRGTPENIQPFTPLSRVIRNGMYLLGIDWDNNPLNLEARARKAMGLPAFDKWEDYRIDRALSNMAASGKISVNDAMRAMITREGEIFENAKMQAGKETAGGGLPGFIFKTLGIPLNNYPEGEKKLRSLQDDFARAYQAYDAGNTEALSQFFDAHPEYETRLALFKEPQERMRSFLVDELWSQYRSLPSLTKSEVREQLGNQFQQLFLDSNTRSYESISTDQMQIWLKLMGGEPVGTLNSTPLPLDLTSPDIAYRAQAFYDMRKQAYGNYYELQNEYFALKEGAPRKAFLKQHPELIDYWDWRNDWLYRNPDIAPYLTDKPLEYKSAKAYEEAMANQPNYTWQEWGTQLSPPAMNLLEDYIVDDMPLTDSMRNKLEKMADDMGITLEKLLELMQSSYQNR
jgi:hypothetical protein